MRLKVVSRVSSSVKVLQKFPILFTSCYQRAAWPVAALARCRCCRTKSGPRRPCESRSVELTEGKYVTQNPGPGGLTNLVQLN